LNEYDRLFKVENVDNAEGDFKDYLNEQSLTKTNAWAEPALVSDASDMRFQFLRKGYFYQDITSTKEALVFNRTVTLKDAWAKEQKK
jgi:glutaminyl-tRNA synthetase